MKNSSKVLIALGTGLAIGGILGVLFAPARGTETRKKIIDTGNELTNSMKENFQKGKERLSDLKESIHAGIGSLKEKAEQLV